MGCRSNAVPPAAASQAADISAPIPSIFFCARSPARLAATSDERFVLDVLAGLRINVGLAWRDLNLIFDPRLAHQGIEIGILIRVGDRHSYQSLGWLMRP